MSLLIHPKIKICGMRDSPDIQAVLPLNPDFLGFIFSEKSLRFAGENLNEELLKQFPRTVQKVGVFVNANLDFILRHVRKYSLDFVQLHGDEMPVFCQNLRNKGVSVIKAFPVDNDFNFNRLNNYKLHCDYFLFDTKGENPGGNGVAFDWNLLQNYDQEKPFFLSGGISPESVKMIKNLPANLNLFALDLNSRFEISPGMKDIEKLRSFMMNFKPVLQENRILF
jgi:phosphoribosylanthranilate isomerase